MDVMIHLPNMRPFTIHRLDGLQLGKTLMHFLSERRGADITLSYNTPTRSVITNPIRKAARQFRTQIVIEQEGRCAVCYCKHELTIDHITPIREGGLSTRENLRGVCVTCHRHLNNPHYKPCLGHRIELTNRRLQPSSPTEAR